MGAFGETVAERPQPRRFHSEPRQSHQATNVTLPAAQQNVPQTRPAGRFTAYVPNGYGTVQQYKSHREQSLPTRKPKLDSDGRVRKINSAPDQEKAQGQGHQKPKVTVVVKPTAGDADMGPEVLQRIHGVPTRAHEENYLRSNKFASSWAQVRAENLALRDGSPVDFPATHRTQDSSYSPGRGLQSKNETSRDSSPNKPEHLSAHQSQQYQTKRFVITRPRGRPPNKQHRKKEKISHVSNGWASPTDNNSKPLSDDESRKEDEEGTDDSERKNDENDGRYSSCERKARRPAWNSNVNVVKDSKPPPKINSRRYEAELTFKPTLTSADDVYNAYTGNDNFDPRHAHKQFSDEDEAYVSPYEDSNSPCSNSSSPNRSKERVLTKREAEMYIKMTAVYGSDAYKNQRKEWFLQRLAKVQEIQTKLAEDKKKADQKKKEEDLKRQNRQLNYVRKKFRREQRHRFRTQYVTSRVLEHEYANRHEFGLPEDYDEFGINDGSQKDIKDASPSSATKDVKGQHLPNSKNNTGNRGHENASLPPKGSPQNQISNQQKMINKQQALIKQKKLQQEQRKAEEKKRAQEQQRAWYSNDNPASEQKSSSVASQVTSGYESSKTPLDQQSLDLGDHKTENRKHSAHSTERPLKGKPPHSQSQINDKHATEKFLKGKSSNSQNQADEKHSTERSSKGKLPSSKSHADGKQAPETLAKGKSSNSQRQTDDKHTTDRLSKGKSNNSQSHTNDNMNRHGLFSQKQPNQKEDNVRERYTRNHKATNKPKEPSNQHAQKQTVSSEDKGISIQEKEKFSSDDNLPVPGKETSKIGRIKKDEKEDKALVYTGHFRQERDEDYHQINDSDRLTEAHVKASEISKYRDPNGSERSKENNSLSGGKVPHSNKNNKTTSNVQSANKTQQDSEADSVALSSDHKTHQTFETSPPKHSLSTTNKQNIKEKDQTKNKAVIPIAKYSSIKKDSNTYFSGQTVNPAENQNTNSIVPKPNYSALKTDIEQKDPSATEKGAKSASVSSGSRGFSKDTKQPNQNGNSRTTKATVNENSRQGPSTASENIGRTDRKHTSGASSNQRDVKYSQTNVSDRGRQKQGQDTNVVPKSSTSRGSSKTVQKKGQGNAALAAAMFNVKTGPSWDPKSKVPKMEGIDTVVVTTQDGKGRVVKKKKNVKDVVKEADNMLKVPIEESPRKDYSRQRYDTAPSPDVTLGSDFDLDDDEDETENDIFERLRKKYNIKIDSDDEDDNVVIR